MNMPAVLNGSESQKKLRSTIKNALKDAIENGAELRVSTLRLLECAMRERDLRAHRKDECRGCDDTEIRNLIEAMVDQREVAVREYEAEGRIDLAEQEREELEILREFLPQRLPDTEVAKLAEQVVTDLGASNLKDMGRCVTELKARFPDQIDAPVAKKAVKKLLM